jgi:hypothetical protein
VTAELNEIAQYMTSLDPSMAIGASFISQNRTLMHILENLEKTHPTVAALILPFKVLFLLEMQRRTSEPKVFALLLKVQDTMTVFVQYVLLVFYRLRKLIYS